MVVVMIYSYDYSYMVYVYEWGIQKKKKQVTNFQMWPVKNTKFKYSLLGQFSTLTL